VDNGYSSEIDLRESAGSRGKRPHGGYELELQIEQTENQLDVLLGRNPAAIVRGRSLLEQGLSSDLPAGLPRRCSNAGPTFSGGAATHRPITPGGRRKSRVLPSAVSHVVFPDSRVPHCTTFSAAPERYGQLVQPQVCRFSRRQHRAGVRSAEAIQQQALLLYEQTVQEAFREVADALVTRRKLAELRIEQEGLVESLSAAWNWPICVIGVASPVIWNISIPNANCSTRRYCLCKSAARN